MLNGLKNSSINCRGKKHIRLNQNRILATSPIIIRKYNKIALIIEKLKPLNVPFLNNVIMPPLALMCHLKSLKELEILVLISAIKKCLDGYIFLFIHY